MCYIMISVNHDMEETEVCLALARFYDSPPPSPNERISEKYDPTPKECATSDAPSWGESIQDELQNEVH
jgi:hypothetical protein